ncbi:MAG: acetylglutamate kinase [Nitrospinaceae bacterium]|nr:acetylglutamate kinase [Nitrospinaceae bacterium]
MIEETIRKAAVLIEALPYIQQFRGTTMVVKFGGSAMEDKAHSEAILTDLTFLSCVGIRPVVVHGGGKAISASMREAGIEARFVKGLRVTCERTIALVEKVMRHEINPGIVDMINARGGRATGVPGQEIFHVTKKQGHDPGTGEQFDWGFVGEPKEVETEQVLALLEEGVIPVITPLGLGEDGLPHNINADTAAAALARKLKANKLVFLTDVPGLLRDFDDPRSVLSSLAVAEVEELIERKVIDGGMLPKVQGGVEALEGGVEKVHIVDGRVLHSMLLEIFTDTGVGTQIVS